MNNRGFSLVELMVVVGIIAVLSTIAIPSYKTFQAKARQKEGFNLLSTFYSAAQATKAEFGIYPGNFVQTGFQPVGTLGYRLRSNDGTDIPIPVNESGCITTQRVCTCAGACPNFKTWTDDNSGAVGTTIGPTAVVNACAPLAGTGTTDTTFSVRVSGVISLQSPRRDIYGMDQTKQIAMCSDGLK